MHDPIFSKENYLLKAGHYPEINHREKAILAKLEMIDKSDTRLVDFITSYFGICFLSVKEKTPLTSKG